MADKGPIQQASKAAGGWGSLKSVGQHLLKSGQPITGARTLLKTNQPDGFDCPGCAWGDPEHGSSFEFCENGVKAVSWEATSKRATPEFFAHHTVSELQTWSDYELEHQGRLTDPMRYNRAKDTYEKITWDTAFLEIARQLNTIDDPNRAEFYTSGRASNEAAFLYQTFVRLFGTNNFPDCSNMCHEASGVALSQTIGSGKGTVQLEDFEQADLIFVVGQNPGTNHPRMLSDLRKAVARGAQVVVLNPLKEKGLSRFADPQDKLEMLRAGSKPTSTHYYSPRLGGDMAVFRGMAKCVFEAEEAAHLAGEISPLDVDFIERHCSDFHRYKARVLATSWDQIEHQSGLTRSQISAAAALYMASERVIVTWAMGITQHKHSVATIKEIASFMLLRGNVGKDGAGLCPVRGHSNVQGDRTVGINEKAPTSFLDAMEQELGVSLPRAPGHNVIGAIGAILAGEAQAFMALGGNFARAIPDSPLIAKAMQNLKLTVHIATKLNHSHLMTGEHAYLLPCLGRTEIDRNSKGDKQMVTVEDSMSMVHGSSGIIEPISAHLKSEVAIIAGIAQATLAHQKLGQTIDWAQLADNYDKIRDMIARVLPIFGDFNQNVRQPRGFHLENAAANRKWNTASGKAIFTGHDLPIETDWQRSQHCEQTFILQTFRSHDQYNTTIYGMNDRYRGVYNARNVIFINPGDLKKLKMKAGDHVNIIGVHDDGMERIARNFMLVSYEIPRGCVGGYYPELNLLVPHQNFGDQSFTPTSKSIEVRFEPAH